MSASQQAGEKFRELIPDSSVYEEFNQSTMLVDKAVERGLMTQENRQGLCFELCRRWVSQVFYEPNYNMAGFREAMDTISFGALKDLVEVHKSRCSFQDEGNFTIEGTGIDQNRGRARRLGCFFYTGLRNRGAILEHIYKNPGLYLYFYGRGAFGHVVGIEYDSAAQRIQYYDPNLGLYRVTAVNKGKRDNFLKWFSWMWSSNFDWGTSYKRNSHNGTRKLVCYTKV